MHRTSTLLTLAAALILVATAAGPAQALSLPSLTVPLAETGPAVHPGDHMSSSVGECTVNFVFDGLGPLAGNVYMGTAAHCVSDIGATVSVAGTPDFATVAYHGGDAIEDDFAFLLVAPEHAERVQASVRGHPGTPTGVATTAQTGTGDLLLLSGYGLGYSLTAITREERVGVLWSHDSDVYIMEAPIIFGDSGGPVVHEASGAALGIVSSIVAGCCAGPGLWMTGPSVDGMIEKAAAADFTVELRTA